MTSQGLNTTNTLTYAGVLPFFIAVLLALFISGNFNGLSTVQLGQIIFVSYSVLIASFMAGTLWGRLQGRVLHSDFAEMNNHPQILTISNILCIAAWGFGLLALIGQIIISIIGLMLVHIMTFAYERHHWRFQASNSSDFYTKLRLRVTTVVAVLHIFAVATFNYLIP